MATETEKTPTTPDLRLIGIGVTAVVAAAGWAALGKDSFGTVSETALNWVLGNFDWLFVVSADVFLVLCVVIAVSRFGRIPGWGRAAPPPPQTTPRPTTRTIERCKGPASR
ncbi:BCCT family transporter, partial [Nocardia brasiliensis]|uniref:BCCT family transporter n=1 Tax=Nocardia brasiliensis TaxID=37326 RepID=UPI00245763C4